MSLAPSARPGKQPPKALPTWVLLLAEALLGVGLYSYTQALGSLRMGGITILPEYVLGICALGMVITAWAGWLHRREDQRQTRSASATEELLERDWPQLRDELAARIERGEGVSRHLQQRGFDLNSRRLIMDRLKAEHVGLPRRDGGALGELIYLEERDAWVGRLELGEPPCELFLPGEQLDDARLARATSSLAQLGPAAEPATELAIETLLPRRLAEFTPLGTKEFSAEDLRKRLRPERLVVPAEGPVELLYDSAYSFNEFRALVRIDPETGALQADLRKEKPRT